MKILRLLGRLLGHVFSANRWATVLDIAIKVGTVVALGAAGYHYLLRTDVVLVVNSSRMLDSATVQKEYSAYGDTVPHLVIEAVQSYVKENLDDLRIASNESASLLSKADLCAADADFVRAVSSRSACEPTNDRALTKYYERKLIHDNLRAGKPLTVEQVRRAFAILRRSEYRRYRACVRNVGRHPATDVEIFPAAGYKAADGFDGPAFSLRPGEESVRDFVTEVGYLDGQPPAIDEPSTTTTSTTVPPSGTTSTTFAPGAEQRIPNLSSSIPEGSCLRKPGAADRTFFTVDWTDNPARPSASQVGWGVLVIGVLLLVLFLRPSTGSK